MSIQTLKFRPPNHLGPQSCSAKQSLSTQNALCYASSVQIPSYAKAELPLNTKMLVEGSKD